MGAATTVAAVRGPMAPDSQRVSRFRVAHGQIVEQWDEPADEVPGS